MRTTEPHHLVSADRWDALCASLDITSGQAEFRRLTRAWRSFGRHYHTLVHLGACLEEFDGARHLATAAAEVELALWFHDAVYRSWRNDNELRSAEWATRFLLANGADAQVATRVRDLVLATAHVAGTSGGDAALVVDVDLSILGQPPDIYDGFERNVRREYWWVPSRRFVTARCAILGSFLERSSIYHLPHFRDRYEAQARSNLERALRALG